MNRPAEVAAAMQLLAEYPPDKDAFKPLLAYIDTLEAANGWVRVKTLEDLPKKPGKMRYEQIDCMVLRDGNYEHLVWNCEHGVWDDHSGDDFECVPLDVQAYFIIPDLPTPPSTATPREE